MTSVQGAGIVGQGRCQDQDQDQDQDSAGPTSQLGPPAAPSEAGERGERGPRSASELAPPAHQCCGLVRRLLMTSPLVPVASDAVGQDSGAGHAGALLPPPGLNGSASPFPAPPCVSVPAALSSDEGPAPQLPPPPNLPAPAPVPAPVVAPSESLRAPASRAPESSRDDPFAELSPGRSSAAPLLHPQRQRELIEQAAGMSTRQVAGLLAAAAPILPVVGSIARFPSPSPRRLLFAAALPRGRWRRGRADRTARIFRTGTAHRGLIFGVLVALCALAHSRGTPRNRSARKATWCQRRVVSFASSSERVRALTRSPHGGRR